MAFGLSMTLVCSDIKMSLCQTNTFLGPIAAGLGVDRFQPVTRQLIDVPPVTP